MDPLSLAWKTSHGAFTVQRSFFEIKWTKTSAVSSSLEGKLRFAVVYYTTKQKKNTLRHLTGTIKTIGIQVFLIDSSIVPVVKVDKGIWSKNKQMYHDEKVDVKGFWGL